MSDVIPFPSAAPRPQPSSAKDAPAPQPPEDAARDLRPGLAFAGSGLERAAALRGRPEVLARHLADPATRILPLWRGRPLFAPETAAVDPAIGGGLVALAPGAPLLEAATQPPIFLGLSAGVPVFAADVSAWVPQGVLPDPAAFFDASEQIHPDLPPGAVFAELRGQMARLDPRAAELAASARALLNWHQSHRFCSACGAPSEPTQAGWQRGCPSCGAQHFPRTDPVVIMRVTRGNSVLLGRSPGWPEGMYSCLAGFMEPGEPMEGAVRREVFEETAVRVGAVRYLASQPWPFPASLMLGCAAEALSTQIRLDPVELEDAVWISRERLADVFAGADRVIRAPRPGAIAGWMLREWLADRRE
ncbi:MAG: NAD(+) diphosphatase [Paenirhodobacter sp.]|uniref:NAD(+) diphosphatase n=1 Tax=Paenirhodobacter sp. TaxID=1965326 RepID=UPI003D0EEC46